MPQLELHTLLMKMAAPGSQLDAATTSLADGATGAYGKGFMYLGMNGWNPLKWKYNPLKWRKPARLAYRGGFGAMAPFGAAGELLTSRGMNSVPAEVSSRVGNAGSWWMPSAGALARRYALARGATMAAARTSSRALGPIGWLGFGGATLLQHYADKMHDAWKQEDTTNANAADTSRRLLAHLAMMDPAVRAQKMQQKPFQTAMINASQAVGGKPIHMAGRKDISPIDLANALGVSRDDFINAYNPNSESLAPVIKRDAAIGQFKHNLGRAGDWVSQHKAPIGIGLAAAGLSIPAMMALRAKMTKRKKKTEETPMDKASAYLHKVAYGVNAREPVVGDQPTDQNDGQPQGARPSNIMEIQNLMRTPSPNPSDAWGQDVVAAQGRGTQNAQNFVRGSEIPNRIAQQKERAHAYTQSLPEVQMQNRMRAGMHPVRNEALPQRGGTSAPHPVTIRPSMSFAEWQKGKAQRMAAQAAMVAKTRAQAAAGGGVTYNVRRPAPARPAAPTAQAVAAKLDRIPNLQATQAQWQRQNNSRMAARRSSPQAQQNMPQGAKPNPNFKQAPPQIAVPRPPQR